MTPLRVWLRRSLAVWTAPLLVAALTLGAWSHDGWQYEWQWGLRAVLTDLGPAAAVIAAGVAYDVARRWQPVLQALGPSTRRWRQATLTLAAAHVLWAFGCVCLVWAASAVRLAAHDAIWEPDPWLPVEALASLTAAGALGLLVGIRLPTLAAPPLAALLVFGAQAIVLPYGFASVFAPMALVGSGLGIARNGDAAALAVVMALALTGWCCVFALHGVHRNRGWRASAGVATVMLLAVVVVEAKTEFEQYRPTASSQVCVTRGQVQLCGPENARSFLRQAVAALDETQTALAESGLNFPQRYALGVTGVPPNLKAQPALARISPLQLFRQPRPNAMAQVLSEPRVCPQALEAGEDTTQLVDDQQHVENWIRQALRGGTQVAPPDIRTAHQEILTCHVS